MAKRRENTRRQIALWALPHSRSRSEQAKKKPYNIPLENVCKAVMAGLGNYSKAARILSNEFSQTVTPGFVLSRLKRAGITKEGLQTVGDKTTDYWAQK